MSVFESSYKEHLTVSCDFLYICLSRRYGLKIDELTLNSGKKPSPLYPEPSDPVSSTISDRVVMSTLR